MPGISLRRHSSFREKLDIDSESPMQLHKENLNSWLPVNPWGEKDGGGGVQLLEELHLDRQPNSSHYVLTLIELLISLTSFFSLTFTDPDLALRLTDPNPMLELQL